MRNPMSNMRPTDLCKSPPRVQRKDQPNVEVEELLSPTQPTHRIVVELNRAMANLIWDDLVDNGLTNGIELDDEFPRVNSFTREFILAVKEVACR